MFNLTLIAMIRKYSVGMDMAKKNFKACLSIINDNQEVKVKASSTFDNTPAGYNKFWSWQLKHQKEDLPICFTMESTGSYHEKAAWFLHSKSKAVNIVLPNRAKAYLTSLGHKSKNDKMDAKGLAHMGAVQRLKPWTPISQELYSLRGLTRHLEDLQNLRTSLNNQKEQNSHGMFEVKQVAKSINKTLKALDKQITDCKKNIADTLQKDERLARKTAHITSIKGVSTITAAVIIAETNGFELINNMKQLTSYAGYDVKQNQSGQMNGKTRISKKGNAHIRRAMHLPAFNMIRYNVKPFNDLYSRVYERTGTKMKAYVAVQRKLLSYMYTLWKNEENFDPEYPPKPYQKSQINKTAGSNEPAALDELETNQALFSIS